MLLTGKNNQIRLFAAALALCAAAALAFAAYWTVFGPSARGTDPGGTAGEGLGIDADEAPAAARQIDGVKVEPGQDNPYPLAVMLDNHPDGRPSSGLSGANLVFEAEAEGGITRYLAVFAGNEAAEKIGPVRSARPYFLDYARELSALYAHVGGSPEALALMKRDNVLNIDEFYNSAYFWRDPDGFAPHNVYTSSERLYSYLEKRGLTDGKYFPWLFKDDPEPESRPATSSIAVNFGYSQYNVVWRYDQANNAYVRYLGGSLHREADGRIITAKNVVVARVGAKVLDELMRLKMDTIGTGTAHICLDGACAGGIWKKASAGARLRFYYPDGQEAAFNRGTSWIELIRPEKEVLF